MNLKNIIYYFYKFINTPLEPEKAYDIWSDIYDSKESNLVFMLESEILDTLLKKTDLAGKTILDLGCGTGRNWQKLLTEKPQEIIGCDISQKMLEHLKDKYPGSRTYKVDRQFSVPIQSNSIDFIFSTLVVAQIKNIKNIFKSCYNWLKPGGMILITDLHPQILASGGKRTFEKDKKVYVVKNYVHTLEELKMLCAKFHLDIIEVQEKYITEDQKEFYEKKNALGVYEKFFGFPLVYGMLMRK